MGNVLILRPIEETLVFREAAEAKASALFCGLIDAARKLIDAQGVSDESNAEIVALQREYQRARERVQFIAETFEVADDKRAQLWALMPEGELVKLVVSNEDVGRKIVLLAKRKCARVVCSDFDLIEGLVDQALLDTA